MPDGHVETERVIEMTSTNFRRLFAFITLGLGQLGRAENNSTLKRR
jgi:hypothetical protein